jgi:hypothetical protein
MGIFSKALELKVAQKIANRIEARGARKQAEMEAQYMPAPQANVPVQGRGHAVLQRAGNFYHRNPKLVASLATALLAGVAAAVVARRRGLH